MDLKELLPLVAMIALSIFVSAKKKKQQQTAADEEDIPQESPWDDLMRELTSGSKPQQPVVDPPKTIAEPIPRVTVRSETYQESSGSDSETFSYDDEVIRGLESRSLFSYETPMAAVESRPVLPIRQQEVQAPTPLVAGASTPVGEKDKPSVVHELFPQGFDPKMAVLYAEILKPRF